MTEPVRIPVGEGGERPGLLAMPTGAGPHPGVVVIHDILGFKPDVGRHCGRFAAEGYAAIAPDLYDGGRARCVIQTLLSLRRGEGPSFEVIASARRHLAAQPGVDPSRIGVTGFCMGGGFALLAAADDAYAVAAPFYGDSPARAERLEGICPTLAQYGERDALFLGHAKRLRRHLRSLGVEHEVLIHPGVGHSFMNDHGPGVLTKLGGWTPMRAAYDAPTEAIAWEKLLAFFARHMPAA